MTNIAIPESHLDLLTRPIHGILSTVMPDRSTHQSVVWRIWHEDRIVFSTDPNSRKLKNIQFDKRISMLFLDCDNPSRYLVVCGTANLIVEDDNGKLAHLIHRLYVPEGKMQSYSKSVLVEIEPTKFIAASFP